VSEVKKYLLDRYKDCFYESGESAFHQPKYVRFASETKESFHFSFPSLPRNPWNVDDGRILRGTYPRIKLAFDRKKSKQRFENDWRK